MDLWALCLVFCAVISRRIIGFVSKFHAPAARLPVVIPSMPSFPSFATLGDVLINPLFGLDDSGGSEPKTSRRHALVLFSRDCSEKNVNFMDH
jgi:hypothetical protein